MTHHNDRPDAAKVKDIYGDTVLHRVLYLSASNDVTLAVLAAWPDAAKEWPDGKPRKYNMHNVTPLEQVLLGHTAITSRSRERVGNRASDAVVRALLAACPDAAKERSRIYAGATMLVVALCCKASEAKLTALLAAWPDAITVEADHGGTPLHDALRCTAPEGVVTALLAALPGAVNAKIRNPRASRTWRFPDRFEGNTALHMLAEGEFQRDRTCTLFYLLIANGALLSEPNARGNTALQISVENACHHLAATLKEIAMYQSPKHRHLGRTFPSTPVCLFVCLFVLSMHSSPKHRHLGREHFRDWTTASHTWCTPSAKLTALMVLLVGCSYKRLAAERGMPRLPMDCWYLNNR